MNTIFWVEDGVGIRCLNLPFCCPVPVCQRTLKPYYHTIMPVTAARSVRIPKKSPSLAHRHGGQAAGFLLPFFLSLKWSAIVRVRRVCPAYACLAPRRHDSISDEKVLWEQSAPHHLRFASWLLPPACLTVTRWLPVPLGPLPGPGCTCGWAALVSGVAGPWVLALALGTCRCVEDTVSR